MRTTEKGIDGLKNAGGAAADKVKGKAEDLKDAVRKKATTFGDKVRAFNDEHFDRETVGDRIRNYNKAKAEEQRKSRESAAKQKATRDNTSKTQSRQTQALTMVYELNWPITLLIFGLYYFPLFLYHLLQL